MCKRAGCIRVREYQSLASLREFDVKSRHDDSAVFIYYISLSEHTVIIPGKIVISLLSIVRHMTSSGCMSALQGIGQMYRTARALVGHFQKPKAGRQAGRFARAPGEPLSQVGV